MLLALDVDSLDEPLDLVFVPVGDADDVGELAADELTDQVFQDHAIDSHWVRPHVPEEVLDRANVLPVLRVRRVRLNRDASLLNCVVQDFLVILRRHQASRRVLRVTLIR